MRELLIALAISLGLSVVVPSVFSAQNRDNPDATSPRVLPNVSSTEPSRPERAEATASALRTQRTIATSPLETRGDRQLPTIAAAPDAIDEPAAAALSSEAATAAPSSPPNELGQVLVLEYHLIERPAGRWSRTPEQLRADIQRLIEENYYPINLIDLARGYIDVPAGKSPVVLTFDDSSSGQCRYFPDGTVDPDSACGILLDAAREHPEDWRARATFFPLIDVDVPDRELFGQPEWAQRKLRDIVSQGMEIGSHTVSHIRLDRASPEMVRKQLAEAEATLERLIPGYEVRSLSLPFGAYPDDERLLVGGEWLGQSYDIEAAVEVAGGPSPSPYSPAFDRLHIRRIQVFGEALEDWLAYFSARPELRYVSDGHPGVVVTPDWEVSVPTFEH